MNDALTRANNVIDLIKSSVIVLTTLPANADAEAFARTLVGERLAACVTILPPVQSIYRWQGAVEQATEKQLIIKTAVARVKALQARVMELHPYDVPEFLIVLTDGGSDEYLSWIKEST